MSNMTDEHLRSILRHCRDLPGTAIETGTAAGNTTKLLVKYFDVVHTVEYNEQRYLSARKRLPAFGSIICHHGNSANVLKDILPSFKVPICFYLDAHWYGGMEKSGQDVPDRRIPLMDELALIQARTQEDFVIVDDIHCFGRERDKHKFGEGTGWLKIGKQTIAKAMPRARVVGAFNDQFVLSCD